MSIRICVAPGTQRQKRKDPKKSNDEIETETETDREGERDIGPYTPNTSTSSWCLRVVDM